MLIRDIPDPGLTAIDDRRLIADFGTAAGFRLILNPDLVVNRRWLLVLDPQGSSIRNRFILLPLHYVLRQTSDIVAAVRRLAAY